jgi:NAD+ kinase
MLRAARAAALHEVPVVGINFGRLGYLTQLDPDDALEAVPRALAGAGSVEDRLMLRCSAVDGDRSIGPIDAVNDVFVGRGRVARAVRLDISVDSHTMARVAADGVVVATPVGSTAYSMSAGGPIVVPSLDALVLTPVVPHPTTFPPLVLAPGARIEIAVQSDDEAALSVDGQLHHTIGRRAQVLVEASPHRARFLRLDGLPIDYAALMRRLHP